ncbi:hypothetical protein GQ473_06310, partial [archaeon]|nr:hypothetical protein [archaeon]
LYDDFDDDVIGNIWNTHVGNGGSISESGGEIRHYGDGDWHGANHYSVATIDKTLPIIIDFDIRYPSARAAGGNGAQVYIFNTTQITGFGSTYDSPLGIYVFIDISPPDSTIYDTRWRIILDGSGNYILTRLSGTAYISDRTTTALSNWGDVTNPIVIDFTDAIYGSRYVYWDNIIIRQYTDVEPTYSIGAEQTSAQSSVVSKSSAYSIGANTTHAFAMINDQIITAPISSGWNHIALTYDKNVGISKMKLYVGGVEKTNATYSTAIATNSNDILIGDTLIGTIDEVRIYNKTLTASEITDTYDMATLSTTTDSPKASINGDNNITHAGTLTNGATATINIDSDNFTVGTNNITIYTDAGVVDYSIDMNGLSALISNTGMNDVTVKQVVAFKTDGSMCLFDHNETTFDVGDFFSVSGCPMSCNEFTNLKAYTDCTGVFGEYNRRPSGC